MAGMVGRGLTAGVAGTAAMTLSSTLESKLRHREPSTTPAAAAGKVLGVEPRSERAERRFNNVVHWAYGTGWGAVRGLLRAAGLTGAPAALAHLGTVWGAEQVVLPATEVASPVWKWSATEVGTDLFHHAVYATATSLAFDWLERH